MAYLAEPEPNFSKFDFSQYMSISPQLAGLYAHSAMANFFRGDRLLSKNWFPEQTGSIWKLDMKWRSDLQYKNDGVNAVWELKPISNFVNSSLSLSGKSQVKFYADMESYTQNKKFYVGSSNGAPIPPINGRTLNHMGYQFSYMVPFGGDGMIYYSCLNCDSPERERVRETNHSPKVTTQTVNQIGAATAAFMVFIRILPWLLPN